MNLTRHLEKRKSLLWKILNFEQLLQGVETAQPTAIVCNLASKIAAYSGHTLQKGSVGRIKVDAFAC